MARKKIFDQAIEEIERGQKGENKGLPMGLPKLVDYVPNLQKNTYYLIGGNTGAGKSAFTDEAFMFSPFEHLLDLVGNGDIKLEDVINHFEIIYYSFEINKVNKILKAIARRIYKRYGVLIDMNYLLSRGKNRVSAEIYNYAISLREYFDALEDIITIIDMAQPPDKIKSFLHTHARRNGKLEISPIGEFHYEPKHPNKITVGILDHAGLSKAAKGKNTKETIDEISQDFVPIRNIYGYSPVLIQQLTSGSASVDRMKGNTRKAPVLDDFGSSKFTPFDANIVFALFNPSRLEMPDYKGYNIGIFKDRFRSLELLKNRDGSPDITLGMLFLGEIGMFKELPRPNEDDAMSAVYKRLDELPKLKPKKDDKDS